MKTLLLLAALSVTGCSQMTYSPPTVPAKTSNSITIAQPRDAFWPAFTAALKAGPYPVKNVDDDKGVINLSYSGDPEKFLDCGEIAGQSYGQASQSPAARANQTFQVILTTFSVYTLTRQLSLDSNVDVSVKAIDPQRTTVAVNTGYVLNRKTALKVDEYEIRGVADSIAFNGDGAGVFEKVFPDDEPPTCRSRGVMEKEILAIAERAGLEP